MTETLQALIDEVIDSFDFEKVQKVMEFVDWKWIDHEGELTVPSVPRLKGSARRSLKLAYDSWKKHGYDYSVAGTGGFEAQYWGYEKEGSLFTLRFVLEQAEAEESSTVGQQKRHDDR